MCRKDGLSASRRRVVFPGYFGLLCTSIVNVHLLLGRIAAPARCSLLLVCYGRISVVCRSVCRSRVTTVRPAKAAAKAIVMPFGMSSRMGPTNHIEVQITHERGRCRERKSGRHIVKYSDSLPIELCNKSLEVAKIGDRLATIYMGLKVGGCCAPFRGRSWIPI